MSEEYEFLCKPKKETPKENKVNWKLIVYSILMDNRVPQEVKDDFYKEYRLEYLKGLKD